MCWRYALWGILHNCWSSLSDRPDWEAVLEGCSHLLSTVGDAVPDENLHKLRVTDLALDACIQLGRWEEAVGYGEKTLPVYRWVIVCKFASLTILKLHPFKSGFQYENNESFLPACNTFCALTLVQLYSSDFVGGVLCFGSLIFHIWDCFLQRVRHSVGDTSAGSPFALTYMPTSPILCNPVTGKASVEMDFLLHSPVSEAKRRNKPEGAFTLHSHKMFF